jgi:hypothetical protein
VKQLAEDFAKYLYLPRLRDTNILLNAIQEGASLLTWEQETFATAEGYDDAKKRYLGLRTGHVTRIVPEGESLVVKPKVARSQVDADAKDQEGRVHGETPSTPLGTISESQKGIVGEQVQGVTPPPITGPPEPAKPRRFYGTVKLDANRPARDAGMIAEAVIQHLAGLVSANVEITLEIHADIPDGVPDNVVRTVTENCRTLRFQGYEFEEK